jgi:hypothetical protein
MSIYKALRGAPNFQGIKQDSNTDERNLTHTIANVANSCLMLSANSPTAEEDSQKTFVFAVILWSFLLLKA